MSEVRPPSGPGESPWHYLFAIIAGVALVTPCCGIGGWILSTAGGHGYASVTDYEVLLSIAAGAVLGAIGGAIIWTIIGALRRR
jgi:hypothetical protein